MDISEKSKGAEAQETPLKKLPKELPEVISRLAGKAPIGFIRGGQGTPTGPSERHYEEQFREAEVRRDELEADKRIGRTPVEHGGGQLHTCQLTGNPEIPKAYIHLIYCNRHGIPTGEEGVGDIIVGMDDARPMELTLVLTCPRCVKGQKHAQDCQMHIRQSHKMWELSPGKGPPTFPFLDPMLDRWVTYRSAGVVEESEPCGCPDCGWRFRLAAKRHPESSALVTFVWPD